MSSHELTEWQTYCEIDPFGDERGDVRMAILAAHIGNVHLGTKKNPTPFEPADFMPDFGEQRGTEQTPEEMLAVAVVMNQMFGGMDLRGR